MSVTSHLPRAFFPKPYADRVQKLRVVAGFLLLVAFAWLSQPDRLSLVIGLPFALCGITLRSWAAGHLAKNVDLATSGPFAFMRNPLYTGTCLVAFGLALGSRSLALLAIFTLVLLLIYLPVIELEEQHLQRLFPSYAPYAAYVYRFLPLRRWRENNVPFSLDLWQRNEEYKAWAGFLLAVVWLLWRLHRTATGTGRETAFL